MIVYGWLVDGFMIATVAVVIWHRIRRHRTHRALVARELAEEARTIRAMSLAGTLRERAAIARGQGSPSVEPKPFDPLDPSVDKQWCIACDGIKPGSGFGLTRDQLHWFCADCRADYDDPEALLTPRPAVIEQTQDALAPLGKAEQNIVNAVAEELAKSWTPEQRGYPFDTPVDTSGVAVWARCSRCHAPVWVLPSATNPGGYPLCQPCGDRMDAHRPDQVVGEQLDKLRESRRVKDTLEQRTLDMHRQLNDINQRGLHG